MSTQTIFKTAGSTSQSTELFLVQKAAATSPGDPITGLAYNTSSLTAYYKINGTGAATAITLATQTDTGAYSSGGFVETSSTNAPGCYRFDIPNACLATAGETTIVFNGAANMATHSIKVICTAIDLYDSVRAGMTALANAAAGASGGLLISGSNSGTTTLAALTVTGATTLTGALTGTNASNDLRVNGVAAGGSGGLLISGSNSGTTTLGALTVTGLATWTGGYSFPVGGVPYMGIVDSGTAQSATGTTLVLRSAAAFADSELVGATVVIKSATAGAGQRRLITAYAGSTDTATVDTWTTTPTGTIVYEIYGTAPASSTGTVSANVTQWNGTNISTPATAGIPEVNVKNWNNLAAIALPLVPTTAGRTLDVSATGEAGVDWANVGSPTTSLALTGTTIATTQKVDIETIKTNPVVNAGTVTFPTTATLASTTNITAGTITTATNLTNAPTAGDLTATMKTSVTTAATAATPTAAAVTANVNADIKKVNGVTVNGNGAGTPWGP